MMTPQQLIEEFERLSSLINQGTGQREENMFYVISRTNWQSIKDRAIYDVTEK